MYTSLGVRQIGITADFARSVELAAKHGFTGLHVSLADVAAVGAPQAKQLLASAGVRASAFFCPVSHRAAQAEFEQGLAKLPAQCETARELGMERTSTYILSWHDELDFAANYAFHLDRLGQMAAVFKRHDIRFGLEFLGPESLRAGKKHSFIHDMDGMLKLCRDIGTGNLGLLFDAWHWYTAGGTLADIARLRNADVVDVHVNDAPAGVAMDQLQDQDRRLPGETGVIDVPGFLRGLAKIGYSGPVMVEPFSKRVNAMSPDEAAHTTAEALHRVWKQAGLAP